MTLLWAASPILVILALLLGAKWSAVRAGALGALVAAAVGAWVFGFPGELGLGLASGLAGAGAEAGFTALTILWILGPALGIHELQVRTGSADVLRAALASFSPDPRILALLVAWFFVLFMEGAAGFGASVALAAPFLVAAGFRAIDAVTVALIGHVVGVSFGAVGTPILPQIAATGATGLELARAGGVYHSLLGWMPLAAMVLLVQRSSPPPQAGARPPILPWTILAFVCFALPYTLLWAFVGPELPTLGGALLGGAAFVGLLRWRHRGGAGPIPAGPKPPSPPQVLRAAAPYLVLIAAVLGTRLVRGLRDRLQGWTLDWELFGAFSGSIQLLYHPGSMLLVGFALGAWLQRVSPADLRAASLSAIRRLFPVAVALVAMLAVSRLMVHAGMTDALALAAASAAGGVWPAVAPFVGVLGTFVTGSATASNILFSDFQRETALHIAAPVTGVVGAQGFGASAGNMICPHNVIAAGATVGLERREGEILARTLPMTLLYTFAGGLLALRLLR